MAAGNPYLVHFPDGTDAVHNVIGGIAVEGQALHLDDAWWVIRGLPTMIHRGEGIEPGEVELEVWVDPKPPEEDPAIESE